MPHPDVSTDCNVLLVEDDSAVASAIQTLLCHYEYKVIFARTLSDARRQLVIPLDLIILDLTLPDGNGLDLMERMRAMNCQVPVFVMTGCVDAESNRRMARLKPARCILKPLNFFELLDAIRGVDARKNRKGRRDSVHAHLMPMMAKS